MPVYAKGTTVSTEKSRAEIERMLKRYGATKFINGWGNGCAVLGFEAQGRHIKFTLPIPDANDKRYATAGKNVRSPEARVAAAAADERQRWRALVLVIKAKLEAVETGISSFQSEFLANIVVPGGQTLGELAIPQLAEAYKRGVSMPLMLGSGSDS